MKINQFLAVSLVALFTVGLSAEDQKSKSKERTEMDAKMQEAMKRGSPGEHHKALEPFSGRFKTTSRLWMKPDEKPQESAGSAAHSWILGGRFLKMDMRGDMGGQPFEGIGYLGYDNIRGEYTAVWLDSMNTGIMRASGEFDQATKTYSESGTFSCPMTGEKDMRFRGVWKVIDNDTLSYTMYMPGPDGKEMKGMETNYKRVK